MRLRRFISLTAGVIAAAVLASCTSLSLNGPDILTPPRPAGDRAELQSMIEKDAGGSYTLITPSAGEYKSGVITRDFDGDGNDEAIALYTTADGTAKLLAAAQQGSSYRFIDSVALNSADIGGVSFADIDADGTDELIVGCGAGASSSKLSVCFIGKEIVKQDVADGFLGYVTGDFDGDSAADIMIFRPASAESVAKAALMSYSDGFFSERASCEIDPEMAACARLSFGAVNENIYGAFADGVNEEGSYTTQVIYFDPSANSLVNPLLVYAGYDKTVRSSKIFSSDINSDGITEIPLCEPMAHTKSEELPQVCTAVSWCRCDVSRMALSVCGESVLCSQMGFILTLKTGTLGSVTARCPDKSSMTLYSVKTGDEKSVLGQALLTVNYYDKGAYESTDAEGNILCESSSGVYTCVLAETSGYMYEEVKNSFRLTENIK